MLSRWTCRTGRSCKRCARLLGPYSENALSAGKTADVAAHLAACPACRAELAALGQMARLLRDHRPAAPEPAQNLWGRIEAALAAPEPRRAPVRPLVAALGAAALAFFVLPRPWQQAEPASPPARTGQVAEAPRADVTPVPSVPVRALEAPRPEVKAMRRPDPFAPLPERGDEVAKAPAPRHRFRPDRSRVASAAEPAAVRVVRVRVRTPKKQPRPVQVVLVKPEPTPRLEPEAPPRDIPASTVSVLSASVADADERVPEGEAGATEPEELGPALTRVAEEHPVREVASPTQVSATDSAVDEALDVQRQRELFRYSRFSRR